jgi:hypothetical protein
MEQVLLRPAVDSVGVLKPTIKQMNRLLPNAAGLGGHPNDRRAPVFGV